MGKREQGKREREKKKQREGFIRSTSLAFCGSLRLYCKVNIDETFFYSNTQLFCKRYFRFDFALPGLSTRERERERKVQLTAHNRAECKVSHWESVRQSGHTR